MIMLIRVRVMNGVRVVNAVDAVMNGVRVVNAVMDGVRVVDAVMNGVRVVNTVDAVIWGVVI